MQIRRFSLKTEYNIEFLPPFNRGKKLLKKSLITHVWKSGTCVNKDIMRLVRALFLFTANRNINILMEHIPGLTNISADLLSRLQVDKFLDRHPSADRHPTKLSSEVWRV